MAAGSFCSYSRAWAAERRAGASLGGFQAGGRRAGEAGDGRKSAKRRRAAARTGDGVLAIPLGGRCFKYRPPPGRCFARRPPLVVRLRCTPELRGAPGPLPLPSRPSSSGNSVTTPARIAPAAMAIVACFQSALHYFGTHQRSDLLCNVVEPLSKAVFSFYS